jgi:cytidylate kinase
MYRAATLAVLRAQLHDPEAIAALVGGLTIDFDDHGSVRLNGEVVEPAIRTPEITNHVYLVADNGQARAVLVEQQQAIVASRGAALEGRDATTVICPEATLKVYLDASVEERARRRAAEWQQQGQDANIAEIQADIAARDARDRSRDVGALQLAEDAVPLVTDGMSPAAVIGTIVAWAVQRRPLASEALVQDQLVVGRSRAAGYVRVAEGSVNDPPLPWQLGLTNPSPDRLPESTVAWARNSGGRQAGVLCQGAALILCAGRGATPGEVVPVPMLPQTWYVIEPGTWHAVVQAPGTIAAWAEASGLSEDRCNFTTEQLEFLRGCRRVFFPASV